MEVIDSDLLLVSIPGSPLSLGRLSFLLAGLINFTSFKAIINSNRIVIAFLLVQMGLLLGALASDSIGVNLSRTIAMFLMFSSAFILSSIWRDANLQKALHYFFIANFVYWSVYIISNVVSGNRIVAYSELFRDNSVVNHHISAMKTSISGTYLFYFFLKEKKVYKNLGYLIFFLTIALCVLTESRSNSVFTILIGGLIIYRNARNSSSLVLTGIGLATIAIPLISFLGEQEAISNRFDVSNTEYQQRTTKSRFVLIEYSLQKIFLTSPLGSGITDIKLEYDNSRNFLVHNQYLSFSIGGGIVAFTGVLVWLSTIFKMFLYLKDKRLRTALGVIKIALAYSLLNFYITLFTVDFSGLLFFLSLSIFLMVYRELRAYKLNPR